MADEKKIHDTKKVSPDEAAKLDPKQMYVAISAAPEAKEVEGQHLRYEPVHCVWCRNVVWARYHEPHEVYWHRCGHCGGAFRRW